MWQGLLGNQLQIHIPTVSTDTIIFLRGFAQHHIKSLTKQQVDKKAECVTVFCFRTHQQYDLSLILIPKSNCFLDQLTVIVFAYFRHLQNNQRHHEYVDKLFSDPVMIKQVKNKIAAENPISLKKHSKVK